MNANEYTQACLRTESDPSNISPMSLLEKRIAHGILGLADEAGELVKVLKARCYYDLELDLDNIVEEAGDACWYLALLLDAVGSSFEEVMEKNIAKLKARYPHKFDTDRAINRDLDTERQAMEDN